MIGEFKGAKLRELRLAKGMRQNELAEKVERSKSYICDLEKGRSMPGLDTLLRMAEALGQSDILVFLK